MWLLLVALVVSAWDNAAQLSLSSEPLVEPSILVSGPAIAGLSGTSIFAPGIYGYPLIILGGSPNLTVRSVSLLDYAGKRPVRSQIISLDDEVAALHPSFHGATAFLSLTNYGIVYVSACAVGFKSNITLIATLHIDRNKLSLLWVGPQMGENATCTRVPLCDASRECDDVVVMVNGKDLEISLVTPANSGPYVFHTGRHLRGDLVMASTTSDSTAAYVTRCREKMCVFIVTPSQRSVEIVELPSIEFAPVCTQMTIGLYPEDIRVTCVADGFAGSVAILAGAFLSWEHFPMSGSFFFSQPFATLRDLPLPGEMGSTSVVVAAGGQRGMFSYSRLFGDQRDYFGPTNYRLPYSPQGGVSVSDIFSITLGNTTVSVRNATIRYSLITSGAYVGNLSLAPFASCSRSVRETPYEGEQTVTMWALVAESFQTVAGAFSQREVRSGLYLCFSNGNAGSYNPRYVTVGVMQPVGWEEKPVPETPSWIHDHWMYIGISAAGLLFAVAAYVLYVVVRRCRTTGFRRVLEHSLLNTDVQLAKYTVLDALKNMDGRESKVAFRVQRKDDGEALVMKHITFTTDIERLLAIREIEVLYLIQGHPHVVQMCDVFLSYAFTNERRFLHREENSRYRIDLEESVATFERDRSVKKLNYGSTSEVARSESEVSLTTDPLSMQPEQRFASVVMEYFPLGNVAQFVSTRFRDAVPESLILSVAYQVAHTLRFLHGQDIFHRSLKPENVMVTNECVRQGEGVFLPICLSDFGFGSQRPYFEEGMEEGPVRDIRGIGLVVTSLALRRCGAPLVNILREVDWISTIQERLRKRHTASFARWCIQLLKGEVASAAAVLSAIGKRSDGNLFIP